MLFNRKGLTISNTVSGMAAYHPTKDKHNKPSTKTHIRVH